MLNMYLHVQNISDKTEEYRENFRKIQETHSIAQYGHSHAFVGFVGERDKNGSTPDERIEGLQSLSFFPDEPHDWCFWP